MILKHKLGFYTKSWQADSLSLVPPGKPRVGMNSYKGWNYKDGIEN